MLPDGRRNTVVFSAALEISIVGAQHYLLHTLNNCKVGGLGPRLSFSVGIKWLQGQELFLGSDKLSFIFEIYVCNVKFSPTGVFNSFADKFVKWKSQFLEA